MFEIRKRSDLVHVDALNCTKSSLITGPANDRHEGSGFSFFGFCGARGTGALRWNLEVAKQKKSGSAAPRGTGNWRELGAEWGFGALFQWVE